uniref:Leucine-rich repeat-containing protein DDB_G0290503-like n=1 Tax=Saccoglossus kowalevskii TaxID=10224 RepID=A0ABM0M2T2_SACKO|nr:PREDICTED: putative leucine-rich repeat-containing protein DDB_G0290503-like [Saccoglossus kowalevskii]
MATAAYSSEILTPSRTWSLEDESKDISGFAMRKKGDYSGTPSSQSNETFEVFRNDSEPEQISTTGVYKSPDNITTTCRTVPQDYSHVANTAPVLKTEKRDYLMDCYESTVTSSCTKSYRLSDSFTIIPVDSGTDQQVGKSYSSPTLEHYKKADSLSNGSVRGSFSHSSISHYRPKISPLVSARTSYQQGRFGYHRHPDATVKAQDMKSSYKLKLSEYSENDLQSPHSIQWTPDTKGSSPNHRAKFSLPDFEKSSLSSTRGKDDHKPYRKFDMKSQYGDYRGASASISDTISPLSYSPEVSRSSDVKSSFSQRISNSFQYTNKKKDNVDGESLFDKIKKEPKGENITDSQPCFNDTYDHCDNTLKVNNTLSETDNAFLSSPLDNEIKSHCSNASLTCDGNVSRLITEEDLVDTIFFSCDPESTGKVTVSKLLEYIRMIMLPAQLNESSDIEELGQILDPSGHDVNVCLSAYHAGVTQWIEILKQRKYEDEDGEGVHYDDAPDRETPVESTPERPLPIQRSLSTGSYQAPTRGISDISLVSFGSIETPGEDDIGKPTNDYVELQNQIEDLQFQVKKLTEQNMKLNAQMDTTEDANGALVLEVEELKNKLKSTHQSIQRSHSVREENDDLISTITALEDTNRDLRRKCTQLEKEKNTFEIKISNLEADLQQASLNVESMQKDQRHMRSCMDECKKARKMEDIQEMMEELSRMNKDLKSEKTELENQLLETKQELMTYQVQKQLQLEENEDELLPEKRISPIITSTPFRRDKNISLHSELKSLVSADETLPSPLCGDDLNDDSDVFSTTPTLSMDKFSQLAAQVSFDFQRKKEFILQQINQFSASATLEDKSRISTPEKLKIDVEDSMEFFVEKVSSLAEMKKESDKKTRKLSTEIRRLRGENIRIKKKHEQAIHLLENLSQNEAESSIEIREQLKQSLTSEQKRVKELHEKLTETLKDLEAVREEAHTLTNTLEIQLESRTQLEEEIEELKKMLEETKKLSQDLESEVKQAKDTIVKEQEENKALKEQHNSELKAILDLVAVEITDSGTECQKNTHPSIVSGDKVREAIGRELNDLNSQLAKSRSLLTSLNADDGILKSIEVSSLEKIKNELKSEYHIPSSINYAKYSTSLLDALTLDDISKPRDTPRNNLLDLASSLSSTNALVPPPPSKSNRLFLTVTSDRLNKSCPNLGERDSLNVSTASTQTETSDSLSVSQISDLVSSEQDTSYFSDFQTSIDTHPESPKIQVPSVFDDSDNSSYHTLPRTDNSIAGVEASSSLSTEEYPSLVTSSIPIEGYSSDDQQTCELSSMSIRHPPLSSTRVSSINKDNPTTLTNGSKTKPKPKLPQWQQELLDKRRAAKNKEMDDKSVDFSKNENKTKDNNQRLTQDNVDENEHKRLTSTPKIKTQDTPSLTTVGSDGQVIDLVNGELDEIELTEADKKFNEQLLQEARKVSQKFQNRRGRSERNIPLITSETVARSKTPSPTRLTPSLGEIPRAKSFESLDTKQEVVKGDLKPLNWNIPSKDNGHCKEDEQTVTVSVKNEPENLPVATQEPSDIDIKSDILKALSPNEKNDDIAVKLVAKPHQPLSKLLEENKLQKKKDIKFRMPELSEASETESTREGDSVESDTSMNTEINDSVITEEKKDSTPSSSKSPVTPTLSDSILRTLGLTRKSVKSPGNLSDHEVEAKFNSLALAFKTDKFTLEKRLELQERQRDIAEVNVEKETNLLKASLQEGRMNQAVEVMLNHVENLKRLYEKEHCELEDTKKILLENKVLYRQGASEDDSRLSKRSMSLAGSKDARGRFTQAIAATTLRNKVTGLLQGARRASVATDAKQSLERKSSLPEEDEGVSNGSSKSSTSPRQRISFGTATSAVRRSNSQSPPASPSSLVDKKKSDQKEEDIFQKGFEQGVRCQVSKEITDLREQQRVFCDNLEELMDNAELDLEDEEIESSEKKLWWWPSENNPRSKFLRVTISTIVFIVAVFLIMAVLLPVQCGSKNSIPLSWTSFGELFGPFTDLRHQAPPPQ